MATKKPAITKREDHLVDLTRTITMFDTWYAIQWGDACDRTGPGWGFQWQTEGLHGFAEHMRVPYVAALALNNELTAEELEAWDAWPAYMRKALIETKRQADAEKWANRCCGPDESEEKKGE